MTVNLYDPRHMIEMVEKIPKTHTFFRDTFFKRVEISPTDKIEMDIRKGSRKMAPFVHERVGSEIDPNSGFITKEFRPPLVSPGRLTTVDDILHRMPGENMYEPTSPSERAMRKMLDDYKNLENQITRREEWMCAQAICTGQILVVGKSVNYVIDLDFTNKETITTETQKWSDLANSDPLADLDRWAKRVQITGFVNPNIVIMGSAAADYFMKNEKVLKVLDVKNVNLGLIAPKELPNGTTYIGYLPKNNLSIYTYTEWAEDATGTPTPLVPDNAVIVAYSGEENVMGYAAITIADMKNDTFVTYEKTRVPEQEMKQNPARRFLYLHSKPLPIPAEVNSWFVANVA